MPLDDDTMLVKYKLAKLSDDIIAQRLGIPIGEVSIRWERIRATSASAASSGHVDLAQQLNICALQYQLVGESLSILAKALGDSVTPTELRALIVADPEETVKNILASCIVLRSFKAVDPAESLLEHQKRN